MTCWYLFVFVIANTLNAQQLFLPPAKSIIKSYTPPAPTIGVIFTRKIPPRESAYVKNPPLIELWDDYLTELENLTGFDFCHEQHEHLALAIQKFKICAPRKTPRDEFSKAQVREKWEAQYTRPWPTYTVDTRHMRTDLKSVRYDLHHIIPKCIGGYDAWWNVIPMTSLHHRHIHEKSPTLDMIIKMR
jgi:hypothetical protein